MDETKLKIRDEKMTLQHLRLSLKYRPKIYALILKMKQCIKKKNSVIAKLKHRLNEMENISNVNLSELEIKSTNNETALNSDTKKIEGTDGMTVQNLEVTTLNEESNHKQTNDQIAINSEAECMDKVGKMKGTKEIIEESKDQSSINTETKILENMDLDCPTAILNPDDISTENKYSNLEQTNINSETPNRSMVVETNIQNEKDNNSNIEKSTEIKVHTKDQATQTDKKKSKKKKHITDSEKSLDQDESDVIEELNDKEVKIDKVQTQEELDSPKEAGSDVPWNINENKEKSIAEQVREAAQDALKDSGMVYVESAGMYYDYKTGYYYNTELGLYYHTDTGCYYYYSDDKQFVFHSYPDRSAVAANASLIAHERKKAKKHRMEKKTEEDIDNLTKNLSQDKEEDGQSKPKKSKRKKVQKKKDETSPTEKVKDSEKSTDGTSETVVSTESKENSDEKEGEDTKTLGEIEGLEDGECSETDSEVSDDDDNDKKSNASTSTASDDESVAKHHPPCMRVIVRETSLPKLRVGTLFIVTKDGGTVGREGDHHTVLLKDNNVSRNHLDIRYDSDRRAYMAIDLGSKNGSVLNGSRMSPSQLPSERMEIVHGSTLQLGETKLLCHIHPGNDTCGHCEPGLLMETIEKEKKVAYTRTCNVKMQHELELARLKNKYAPKQLCIEETAYNDRAQARREAVGSSHHSEKTQSTDLSTSITADNKGFKLLEKMGWSKGEGLGKDNQGETEPVPLVSNDGTKGLGAPEVPTARVVSKTLGPATLRLASKTKMLRPPAKAFQQNQDDNDSE